jgi:hypothetical protein
MTGIAGDSRFDAGARVSRIYTFQDEASCPEGSFVRR